MYRIFIDGEYGTTGLKLSSLISKCRHIELISPSYEFRKDSSAKAEVSSIADLTVLCLPEKEISETVEIYQENTRVLDCSSKNRVNPLWVHGLPELGNVQRAAIQPAKLVSNPGCFASAFILLISPLVKSGMIAPDTELNPTAISGYSSGGKRMIEQYERHGKAEIFSLTHAHKHISEMTQFSGLNSRPVFTPLIGNHKAGMLLSILLPKECGKADLENTYRLTYHQEPFIRLHQETPNSLNADVTNGNELEIFLSKQGDRVQVIARMNNLIKGAAGVALQNINLMLGNNEGLGIA